MFSGGTPLGRLIPGIFLAGLLLLALTARPVQDPVSVSSEVTNPRITLRLVVGISLRAGEYPVRVKASSEARLQTRPWMDTRMQSTDSEGTTWMVPVPSEAPYPVHLENQPRQPLSGVLIDLEPRFRGPIQIEVGEHRVTLRPADLELGRPRDFEDGLIRVERLPSVTTVAGTTLDEDYPELLSASDGSLWMGWIEFDGRQDWLKISRFSDSLRLDVSPVDQSGDLYRVELAEFQGQIWVVWSQQVAENWDLFSRIWDGEKWSQRVRLTRGPYPDWNHRLLSDGENRIWLVWQGVQEQDGTQNSEIFLRHFQDGRWSETLNVSRNPASDWEPAIISDGSRAIVAWDTYRQGNFDVVMARSDGHSVDASEVVAGTPAMEIRPDMARDAAGRLWFSWEESEPGWGEDSAAFDRGLHRHRRVRLALMEEGRFYQPASQPLIQLEPHLGPQSEMARLASDSEGKLWIFFRVNFLNRIWQQAAIYLEGDSWSRPIILDASYGRQTAPLAWTNLGTGEMAVAWVSDTRRFSSPFNAVHNDIQMSRWNPSASESGTLALESWDGGTRSLTPDRLSRSSERLASHPQMVVESDGNSYKLFWGELHRHTDINHHGRPDGALEDAYRYARDVAALDFFATTDHITGEPSRTGINQMTWWRSQKFADLHRLSRTFEPLYAYERAKGSPGGHKNLIFARRGGPLFKGTAGHDLPTDLWAELNRTGFPLVVIPHQLTGPAINWRYHDPRWEPVMEIYQGRRQSYEYDGAPQPPGVEQVWGKAQGSWAWDALEKGLRMGFIASSDHSSTHMSFAGLLAEELTRDGILEALKARRTYAASDKILLDFRIRSATRELLMGEEGSAGANPTLYVKAIGTGRIRIVEVIRDNRFVYSQQPSGHEVEFTFVPESPGQNSSYFYVRLIQEDGHMAWSSPIWLEP